MGGRSARSAAAAAAWLVAALLLLGPVIEPMVAAGAAAVCSKYESSVTVPAALDVYPGISSALPSFPSIAAADFDLDGDNDMIQVSVVSPYPLFFSINSAGDGLSWTNNAIENTPTPWSSFCVGNFSGDAYPDLVIMFVGFAMRRYQNNGGASFTMIGTLPPIISSYNSAAESCDLDKDGAVDDIVYIPSAPAGSLSLLRGDGGFAFTSMSFFSSSYAAVSLKLVDINRDGWIDIFLTGPGAFWCAGNGALGAACVPVAIDGAFAVINDCDGGDLTNDGLPDLVCGVASYLPTGRGTRIVFEQTVASDGAIGWLSWKLPNGWQPQGGYPERKPHLVDLNRDGWLDVAANINWDSAMNVVLISMRLLPGQRGSDLDFYGTGFVGHNDGSTALCADFNRDGYPDCTFACAHANCGSKNWLDFNRPTGYFDQFTVPLVLGALPPGSSGPLVIAADVNADVLTDLCWANGTALVCTLNTRASPGRFAGPVAVASAGALTGGAALSGLVAIDGVGAADGLWDFFAAAPTNGSVIGFASAGLFGWTPLVAARGIAGCADPTRLAVLQSDASALGLVVACPAADTVVVLAWDSQSRATSGAPRVLCSGAAACDGPKALAVADVTGDGLQDAVVGSLVDGKVQVFPGLSATGLTFGAATVVVSGLGALGDVACARLDGAVGLGADCVVGYGSTVRVYRNTAGVLSAGQIVTAGATAVSAIALRELTSDTVLDILYSDGSASGLSLSAWSIGQGAYVVPASAATAGALTSVVPANVYGYGGLSVVAIKSSPPRVVFQPEGPIWSGGVIGPRTVVVDVARCGWTLACVVDALVGSSRCSMTTVLLPPGVYGGCSAAGPIVLESDVMFARHPAMAGSVRIDCGIGVGGALFAVLGASVTLRDVSISGMHPRAAAVAGPWASHVLVVSGAASSLTLINVSIRNSTLLGGGFVSTASAGLGGCVLVADGARLTMTNSSLSECVALAGGCLAAVGTGTRLTLANVSLSGCVATAGSGGGLYLAGGGMSVSATGLAVSGSSASLGGGLSAELAGSALSLAASSLSGCSASVAGGGAFIKIDPTSTVALVSTAVTGNTAMWGGGIATLEGRGLSCGGSASSSYPIVPTPSLLPQPSGDALCAAGASGVLMSGAGSMVSGNHAMFGGALSLCGVALSINASAAAAFAGNTAARAGGFVFVCVASFSPAPCGAPSLGAVPWLWLAPSLGLGWNVNGGAGVYGATAASRAVTLALASPLAVAVETGTMLAANAILVSAKDLFGQTVVEPSETLLLALPATLLLVGTPNLAWALSSGAVPVGGFAYGAASASAVGVGSPAVLSLLMPASTSAANPLTSVILTASGCGAGRGESGGSPVLCVACPPLFASAGGQCLACPTGSLDVGTGADECVSCPDSTEPDLTGAYPIANVSLDPVTGAKPIAAKYGVVCRCRVGTYSPARALGLACVACPEHASCAGGLALPLALAGYAPIDERRAEFVVCPRPQSCAGGETQCYAGNRGYLCAQCAEGWYLDASSICQRCPKFAPSTLSVLVLGVCVLGIGIVMPSLFAVRKFIGRFMKEEAAAVEAGRDAGTSLEALIRLRRAVPLVPRSIAIAVAWLQILATLGSIDFRWPSQVRAAFAVMSVTLMSMDLFATACTLPSFALKYIVGVSLPMLLFVVVVLISFAGARTLRVPWRYGWIVVERALLVVAPFAYIPLSKASLSLFDCTRFPDGTLRLDVDMSIECGSAMWMRLMPVGALAVVLYVFCIPVWIVLRVRSVASRLKEPATLLRFGPLYEAFRGGSYWFTAALLGQRLSVVIATLFFSSLRLAQIAILFAMFMVSSVVFALNSPYFEPSLSHLQLALHVLGVFFVLCAYSFSAARFDSVLSETAFAYITIGIIVLGLGCVGLTAMREVHTRASARAVVSPDGRLAPNAQVRALMQYATARESDFDDPDLVADIIALCERARPEALASTMAGVETSTESSCAVVHAPVHASASASVSAPATAPASAAVLSTSAPARATGRNQS